ncbi:PLP-dependent aminotransferase family protein [Clostridium sp. B9]|uniref:aminotransferase-like domain-containing protein n=1 Tax=Clostridium sp. B9 TaxID=3423224 RepID=UPI003D2EFE4E
MFKNLTFSGEKKKYIEIADYIRGLISRGVLIEGSKLPSSREISSVLSIGRNTVMAAYEILESEGLIETTKGKGTFVKSGVSNIVNYENSKIKLVSNKNNKGENNSWEIDWSKSTNEYGKLAEKFDILKSEYKWEKGMISFKSIAPEGDLFNIEELKRAFLNRIALEKHKIVNYGYAVGYKPFIDYLKEYMGDKGAYSYDKEIIVTNGFTEGLDMILSSFTEEGDYILCENPTHNTALKIMKTHKLNIIGVNMTRDGMNIDDLKEKIKNKKIKFAYLIPSYHNPTGIVASIKKREEVYKILKEAGIPIIEDGFNEELLYESAPTIPLASLDRESNGVIYIGSFSKILFPGLRIGWVYGDKRIIEVLESVKRCRNIHSSFLDQGILYDFMISGAFEKYIKKVRKVYKQKYKFTKKVIEKYIPQAEIWGEGGLHIFIKIKGVDTRELLDKCYKRGVLFMPGDLFYVESFKNRVCEEKDIAIEIFQEKNLNIGKFEDKNIGHENNAKDTLRLGFTRVSKEDIEKGIKIIGEEVDNNLK